MHIYGSIHMMCAFSQALHLTCQIHHIITQQYGFNKINKGVYSHPKFRRGDKEGLSQLRKRVKAVVASPSRSSTMIIRPPSRMVSPTQEMWHDAPLHNHPHYELHQHNDASSERLSILAQAVRVAMVLEAGGNVNKDPTFF